MKIKYPATILLLLLLQYESKAQKGLNQFIQFYPIGEDANIGYKTSIMKEEPLVFEANPNVRYSLFNNIYRQLTNGRNIAFAGYVAFSSQFRMYDSPSLPVVMPSYRVHPGLQIIIRSHERHLLSFALESGHYSNGQSGSAFSETLTDGSPESEALYSKITPETDLSSILNRKNANFSTNFTELTLNYRFNKLEESEPTRTHSLTAGLIFYHNRFLGIGSFGGYSQNDIRLYGRYRWQTKYEFTKKIFGDHRFSLAEKTEIISGAHPSVDPFRSETILTYYPISSMKAVGVFTNYTFGHDNYNYRFVDSGRTFSLGITWNLFPPFQITKSDIEKL